MRCIMGKMGILLSDWPSKFFKNVKRFLIGDHALMEALPVDRGRDESRYLTSRSGWFWLPVFPILTISKLETSG